MNNWFKDKANLEGNPFTPSGTGLPNGSYVYLGSRMLNKVERFYKELSTGRGAKTFPLIGKYGSGKSAFMKGFLTDFFWKKKIKAFYIENPGVNFYNIANHVLQSLGRYEFCKALYEISEHYMTRQQALFGSNYDAFLNGLKTKKDRDEMIVNLQRILKDKVQLTSNETVAYSFAKMVIETKVRPFFDYKDFVSDGASPSVPKDKEAEYFNALITAIKKIYGADGVALLLDEFEELTLGSRLSSRVQYEYLSTFRKLIDESQNQNLWIVLAMVPGVETIIERINPPLWERFSHRGETTLSLEELEPEEIVGIIEKWLNSMRNDKKPKSLFPFEEGVEEVFLSRSQLRLPRVIVKVCFQALARASSEDIEPPLTKDYVEKVANDFYPKRKEKRETEDF